MTITLQELTNMADATATIKDFKDNTDPLYIGPGTWNVIHRIAFNSRTKEEQLAYINLIKDICSGFPCEICRGHCNEYIKNHPLEDYLDTLLEVKGQKLSLGMFIWSWKFHNAVNMRTNKPMMSWDTAYNLYSQKDSLVCSKNCLATASHSSDVTNI